MIVEKVSLTERLATVYNLRVLEDHTYFVGAEDWGFSVWVHNTYDIVEEGGKVIVRKQGQDDVVFENWGELFSRYRVGTRDDALKFLNAPKGETLPSGVMNGSPGGQAKVINYNDPDTKNVLAALSENHSADVLAKNGYRVVRQPSRVPGMTTNPDLKIEGNFFDV